MKHKFSLLITLALTTLVASGCEVGDFFGGIISIEDQKHETNEPSNENENKANN